MFRKIKNFFSRLFKNSGGLAEEAVYVIARSQDDTELRIVVHSVHKTLEGAKKRLEEIKFKDSNYLIQRYGLWD